METAAKCRGHAGRVMQYPRIEWSSVWVIIPFKPQLAWLRMPDGGQSQDATLRMTLIRRFGPGIRLAPTISALLSWRLCSAQALSGFLHSQIGH